MFGKRRLVIHNELVSGRWVCALEVRPVTRTLTLSLSLKTYVPLHIGTLPTPSMPTHPLYLFVVVVNGIQTYPCFPNITSQFQSLPPSHRPIISRQPAKPTPGSARGHKAIYLRSIITKVYHQRQIITWSQLSVGQVEATDTANTADPYTLTAIAGSLAVV